MKSKQKKSLQHNGFTALNDRRDDQEYKHGKEKAIRSIKTELIKKGLTGYQTDMITDRVILLCMRYPAPGQRGSPLLDDQALQDEVEKIKFLSYEEVFENYHR